MPLHARQRSFGRAADSVATAVEQRRAPAAPMLYRLHSRRVTDAVETSWSVSPQPLPWWLGVRVIAAASVIGWTAIIAILLHL